MVKKKKLNPSSKIIFGFLIVILLGTFLLCLPISHNNKEWFSFIDSFFTSTSAVCVTGLSVVDIATQFNIFGQIVVLLLIQIGGLGFITLTSLVFLLIRKKITYEERVTIQESLNQDSVQGVVRLVRNIIILVFVTELFGLCLLAPSFISMYGFWNGFFKALFLSVSSFCNAGFDNLGNTAFSSLSSLSSNALVLLPVMFLIIVGGIGYVVLFDLGGIFKKRKLSMHTKITLLFVSILIFGGALLFAIFEWNNPLTLGKLSTFNKIINSLFLSVSPRTAGFSAVDYSALTPGSIILTNILMFIGGGSASTAGGVKITTFVVLLFAIFKSTNSSGDVVFRKKKISSSIIQKSLKVICFALILIISASLIICCVEGSNFTTSQIIFETVSALSTSGLSLGITASVGIITKLILIFLMFIGRVGALTFTLAMGKKLSNNQDILYPDSKIIVG